MKSGYQPNDKGLDTKNPPQGGSGVNIGGNHMFNHKPMVKINLKIDVKVYDTSPASLIVDEITEGHIFPIKKSCNFELHVKKNTCVEEAFAETFMNAKELLETAMKEDKKK